MISVRFAGAFAALVYFLSGYHSFAAETSDGPRMMLNAQIIEQLNDTSGIDDDTRERLLKLRHAAEDILDLPPVVAQFELSDPDRPRSLLFAARRMLKITTELGLAWNLWGDERYATRARKEMLDVAALEDWAPDQFLATAEMMAAMSIGLDWFTDYLSDADKEKIVAALVKLGIEPGLDYFERTWPGGTWAEPQPRNESLLQAAKRAGREWSVNSFNWNMVSNSGLTLAALAVRPSHPELSERVIDLTSQSIAYGFAEYGEDGGFPEGPEYWSLATRYAAAFIGSTSDILGDDFGFSETPGFTQTGDFMLHVTGPTDLAFNYGDSDTGPNRVAMSWLGERYGRPVDAWFARHKSPGSRLALSLVWRVSDEGADPVETGIPTGRKFDTIGVATFRTAWLDPDALFAGLKGGDSGGHHTHLDLGSFVFDGMGQRWAIELGRGDYSLPGYFGEERWNYYRTGTAGQNTLVFDGQNQVPGAVAPLTAFQLSPAASFAITDMGGAYGVPAQNIRRGMAMFDGRTILVQDEIGGDKTEAVRWGMHTRAEATIDKEDPSTMVLEQGGVFLGARIISPPGAQFGIVSAAQQPPQNTNEGIDKVVIDLGSVPAGTQRRIAVLFEPGSENPPDAIDLVPLADWNNAWPAQDLNR